jgi:hypothetical protein
MKNFSICQQIEINAIHTSLVFGSYDQLECITVSDIFKVH